MVLCELGKRTQCSDKVRVVPASCKQSLLLLSVTPLDSQNKTMKLIPTLQVKKLSLRGLSK